MPKANSIYIGNKRYVWVNPFGMEDETQAIIDYASANSYALPSNMTAFNQLILEMKSAGIWQKLDVFYVFCGDGSTGFKLINLINPNVFYAIGNGGLTWNSDGVQGNGSNGYISTGMNPNLDYANYKLDNAARGGFIASYSGTLNFDGCIATARNDYNGSVTRLNGASFATATYDGSLGLLAITRQNSSDIEVTMKNSTGTYSAASSFTSSVNEQGILRRQNSYGNIRLSAYFMGGFITYAETQTFRTIYNNYLTALGLTPIA